MQTLLRSFYNVTNRQVLYLLVAIVLLSSIISAAINPEKWDAEWWSGWLQNFSTEMMGAVATFLLFELIVGSRKEREAKLGEEEQEKQRLLRALGSSVNEVAIRAAEELRIQGWLEDGTLTGANLTGSNLQGANIQEAVLLKTIMIGANLENAKIRHANLSGAVLLGANFRNSRLRKANLAGASVGRTDFSNARMTDANLEGVLDLAQAIFNEKTILPDGTNWTQETDLARFYDSTHPDYWQLAT